MKSVEEGWEEVAMALRIERYDAKTVKMMREMFMYGAFFIVSHRDGFVEHREELMDNFVNK